MTTERNQRDQAARTRTRPQHALDAIIRHERAARAVSALNKAIGEAIAKCPIYVLATEPEFPGADTAALWAGDKVKTHLWHAYNDTVDTTHSQRLLNADEQYDYLTLDADCPHCLKAWQEIEFRRAAKKELGAAKRAIRALGRAALGQEG